MRRQLVILLFLLGTIPLYGQLSVKNQMEFTHWKEYNRDILENWFDLNYQKNFFQIGLRHEINRPPDPFIFPIDSLLKEYELTFRYVEFYYKNLSATIGNFYTMFGRGLTLRSYEDRNLRVDNNIEGIHIKLSGSQYKLQALTGKIRDKYNRRKNSIHGVDGEVSIRSLSLGGSYLHQEESFHNMSELWASRIAFTQDWGDVYYELAKPAWYDKFSHYLAVNVAYSQFSVTMEYKDYNQLSFKNFYGTEYNAAPSLTKEHTYTLLNRYPHSLNLNDEKGYQVELSYLPADEWEFSVNHSQTFNHQKKRIFEEYYGEIHHYFTDNIDARFVGAWTYDFATNTVSITPIIDLLCYLTQRVQLHLSYQHQHIINKFDQSEYDDDMFIIEYSKSPHFSFALVGEYTNKYKLNNVDMDQHYWLYGNLTVNFRKNQFLSILYGSRQAGFVCVGGICRYEPEFKGIEIKLINRF